MQPLSQFDDAPLQIGPKRFQSRLFVGTGKYASLDIMKAAILQSESELVTVALRRVNLSNPNEPSLLDFIPPSVTILPNTAGCYTVEEAVMVAELAQAAHLGPLVKLEVIGDQQLLWPDPIATLKATEILVNKGFSVMVYTTDDPVLARQLEQAGASAVMPLGSPIGSGQGVLNVEAIERIKERVTRVPVVVDAGIGGPADAALAMEVGADAVLINTAIALARDPVQMAEAMKRAVQAGRLGYLAGRMPKRTHASPSSPEQGRVQSHAAR
jgi:thiazole synthase